MQIRGTTEVGAIHTARSRALELIHGRVESRSHRAVRQLRVFVDEDRSALVIEGVTDTYYKKQLAQAGAAEAIADSEIVKGLNLNNRPNLINDIKVA